MTDPEKPKIIVDDDWKTKAQEEKEQLQREAEVQKQATESGEAAESNATSAEPDTSAMPLPPASFAVLVSTLATQAMATMGQIPMPDGKPVLQLDHAKHYIDTLAMLEDKTKGNLDADEMVMLNNVLHELRMTYVQASSQAKPSASE